MTEQEFVEAGAAIEHARWAKWQGYLHSKCIANPDGSLTIPADLVERWARQIATPYDALSEAEKESDRVEVRSYLPLLAALRQRAAEALKPFAEYLGEVGCWATLAERLDIVEAPHGASCDFVGADFKKAAQLYNELTNSSAASPPAQSSADDAGGSRHLGPPALNSPGPQVSGDASSASTTLDASSPCELADGNAPLGADPSASSQNSVPGGAASSPDTPPSSLREQHGAPPGDFGGAS